MTRYTDKVILVWNLLSICINIAFSPQSSLMTTRLTRWCCSYVGELFSCPLLQGPKVRQPCIRSYYCWNAPRLAAEDSGVDIIVHGTVTRMCVHSRVSTAQLWFMHILHNNLTERNMQHEIWPLYTPALSAVATLPILIWHPSNPATRTLGFEKMIARQGRCYMVDTMPYNTDCMSPQARLTVSLGHTLNLILLLDGVTAQQHKLSIIPLRYASCTILDATGMQVYRTSG